MVRAIDPLHAGHIISGTGHAALIGWVLFGSAFRSDPPPMEITEVAVISAADFAALSAPPAAATEVALPRPPAETQDVPQTPEVTPPAIQPETPDVSESPEPETVPETPSAQPIPEVVPETPLPEAPPLSQDIPEVSDRPVARPSERIAPEAVAPPPPEAAPDPVEQAAVTPDAEAPAEQDEPQEEQEQTAPEEASTEITTEAETPSAAPQTSLRPPSRRPTPPQRAVAEAEPEADPEPADPRPSVAEEAVNAALAEALQGSDTQPDAPVGPPLTAGEKDGLRVAVQACWNTGALSSAALETTVVVAVSMTEDGKPVAGSLRMISSSGGTDASAKQAYEAARRAILRCGARGYDLPADKYAQWKDIEMTFNPERMRIK